MVFYFVGSFSVELTDLRDYSILIGTLPFGTELDSPLLQSTIRRYSA